MAIVLGGLRVFIMILWCSQGGDHPETNLANSGYMPDMNTWCSVCSQKKIKKKDDDKIFLLSLLVYSQIWLNIPRHKEWSPPLNFADLWRSTSTYIRSWHTMEIGHNTHTSVKAVTTCIWSFSDGGKSFGVYFHKWCEISYNIQMVFSIDFFLGGNFFPIFQKLFCHKFPFLGKKIIKFF
jgi:hypothetical protein